MIIIYLWSLIMIRENTGPTKLLLSEPLLTVIGHWSLVIGHWSFGHWSLVIGHWSLVIGHWSFGHLVIGHRSFGQWSFGH